MQAEDVQIAPTSSTSEEAHYCLREYFKEIDERFEGGFEDDHSAEPEDLKPPDGLFLLATLDGKPIGCGALKRAEREMGDLKRMWVDPSVRGLGVGRRMLEALEHHAVDLGLSAVRLETNRNCPEALALYRGSGYREVEPFNDIKYAHHWFEKHLAR